MPKWTSTPWKFIVHQEISLSRHHIIYTVQSIIFILMYTTKSGLCRQARHSYITQISYNSFNMYYSYCLAYGIGPKGRINTEGMHYNVHLSTLTVHALSDKTCDIMEHNNYIFNHHPLIFLWFMLSVFKCVSQNNHLAVTLLISLL